jgi:beta-xylosidase
MHRYFLSAVIGCIVVGWTAQAANPVMRGADPDILLAGDTVWMYSTGSRGQFFAYASQDLVAWQRHGPILDFRDIAWIPRGKSAWAPGVTEKNGTYYVYYSVGPKPSHIGVASASSPAGPFTDSGKPLLSDDNDPSFEAIDAMAFTDPNSGVSYLYAGGSAGSRLRVFELNDDMLSFKREIKADNPSHFTEGAFMHYYNGLYYLSYSHGGWNSDTYSVHYSTAPGPVGPWTYRGVLAKSDDRHKGPGHHSFLHNAATNEWYIFYHRWNNQSGPGPYRGSRSIAIEKIHYEPDGRIKPFVLTDTGVGPVPLGQKPRPKSPDQKGD